MGGREIGGYLNVHQSSVSGQRGGTRGNELISGFSVRPKTSGEAGRSMGFHGKLLVLKFDTEKALLALTLREASLVKEG